MSGLNWTELLAPGRRRRLSRLPGLVARATKLLWAAAPREFSITVLLQAVAGAGAAAQVLVGRQVLATVFSADATVKTLVPGLVALAGTTAVVAFAEVARSEQQRLLTDLVGRHATDRVLEAATAAPLIAFERPAFHDRLERARVNAMLRPVNVATGVVGLVSSGFAGVGISVALVVLEPVFLALVVAAFVPSWLVSVRMSRASHAYAVAQTERDRKRAYLMATLTAKVEAQEVRAFDLGAFLRGEHDELFRRRIVDLRALVSRRLRLGLAGAALTSTMIAVTLAALSVLVVTDRLTVAAAGAVAGGVLLLGRRLQAMARAVASLYEGALFLEDFTTFVDTPAEDHDAALPPAPSGFATLTARDLWFKYPGSDLPCVCGASLDVHAGEVVALVGLNGSGKTTLAKLLAGLYQPDSGAIAWDGVDLTSYGARSVRDRIAVIFQDFTRYQLTVGDNISMGRHLHRSDRDAIVSAATRAGAHRTVADMPNGYDTRLGPHFLGGRDLSLGQWQRVALARALFRDAPFVILDEPTASMDAEAEAALFADIRKLCRARSVLLISHRFSTVRSVDRIYVLREGLVAEQGTHDELMARDGHYAALFRTQAASYTDSEPAATRRHRTPDMIANRGGIP